ncbi:type II secretion system major pseudopilin GspG [Microvirga flavescens]|uniref:type II secretion system major pseudopilin GspG n=1 Tax=Microvirga flavescens TaxID=2249811 RepID=UPI000DDC216E|nr:type II secretion system major pseudopilin GspG [Microvirga flavescens]
MIRSRLTSVRTRNVSRACGRFRDDCCGMTLLEILVVMVILGLLATLGSIQLMSYLGRAKTDTARLQVQELMTALDLFRIDVGRLPTTNEGLRALLVEPVNVSNWRGPYLRSQGILADPWRRPYQYKSPGEHGEYDLVTLGADGTVGGEKENRDVANWIEQ